MSASIFLSSLMTVVSFVTFIGIVFWAYSRNRKPAFDAAANAPFALPDDATNVQSNVQSNVQRGGRAS